jgi:eukaryotic-like serine/threonine-protein kinase
MIVPAQWLKVKEIVGEALERDPAERDSFVDEACLQDADLRFEVESLLAAYSKADEFSHHSWGKVPGTLLAAPRTIGPYRLERELGAGGMGQVWLAEQTEPVQRWIALKLIRSWFIDPTVVQRFLLERQSLALMNHPFIAKVYEAGTTPGGQPYLAMEYVDGLPINQYCDDKKLGLRERLTIFLQVCEGVQHAHQKAIIHRDLKPSNILVTEVDGKPMPRIIDFGLAKAAVPILADDALKTRVGSLMGTPGYMSPEQADSGFADVDTRADVYSLGVIFYELLTGFLPFDTQRWKKMRLDEILREINEADPERPSAKVGGASRVSATCRALKPGQLAGMLRGDLDSIALKILEKDRDRRYGTASELAADIARYLEHRPVRARPANVAYRARKYVHRNRIGVAAFTGALALLIAFAATQTFQLQRIRRERDRADRVSQFVTGMFKVLDPGESRGNSITVREILDKAVRETGSQLQHDPVAKAQMLQVMGTAYQNLGLYPKAESLFRESSQIDESVVGREHPDTLASMTALGHNIAQQDRLKEAEQIQRNLRTIETRVLGGDNRLTLLNSSDLSWTLESEGRLDEAERIAREVLDHQRRSFGNDDEDTRTTISRLAWVLLSKGHYPESEKLDRELLAVRQRTLGRDNPKTLLTMQELANVLTWRGENAEAEKLLREAVARQRTVLGPNHQNVAVTMSSLGIVLQHEKRYAEAQALYQEAGGIIERTLGPTNRGALLTKLNLATVQEQRGQFVGAEKSLQEVLTVQLRKYGRDHPDTGLTLFDLAHIQYEKKRYAESASLYRQAADIYRRALGPNHPDTEDAVYNLACALSLGGERNKALSALHDLAPRGFLNRQDFEHDPDLTSLRNDPWFSALVADKRKSASSR